MISTDQALPIYITHPHCYGSVPSVELVCKAAHSKIDWNLEVTMLVPLAIAGSTYRLGKFLSSVWDSSWIVLSAKAAIEV